MRSSFRIVSLSMLVLGLLVGTAGLSSAADTSGGASGAMKAPAQAAAGFTLHIDALKHYPGNPQAVAHHWCRPAENGITECALFDSDAANAQLVGVEVVVPTATWKTFSLAEQAQWHYHRTEIPKVSATLPGMSPDQAKKVVASMLETYGKIYLLWDPTKSKSPVGQPFVYILKP